MRPALLTNEVSRRELPHAMPAKEKETRGFLCWSGGEGCGMGASGVIQKGVDGFGG